VTLIEKENRVLPTWEAEARERVAQALERQGVIVLLNQRVSLDQIDANANGTPICGLGDRAVEADCPGCPHPYGWGWLEVLSSSR
jgi:pyruvate/2-oxoglutarate dehydrogenase complex dihydrolipoamide dehydrogenase (E3) component